MARLIDRGPGCPTPTPKRAESAAETRGLAYTAEVKAATDGLYPLVKDFITPMEWPAVAPLVHAINTLKAEKDAVKEIGDLEATITTEVVQSLLNIEKLAGKQGGSKAKTKKSKK